MSHSDWNDDEQEPPAPLPAHERVWRHPSEVGEQAWRMSEPPLAIGRGLTFATGSVGGLLALVIVWTMLPTHAGRNAVATARTTLVTLVQHSFGTSVSGQVTTALEGAVSSSSTPTTSVRVPPTEPAVTTPVRPMPTFQVHSSIEQAVHHTTDSVAAPSSGQMPVLAVSVDGGSLVITTAAAVADDLTVQLEFADGEQGMAQVVLVDQRSGLAVLAPENVRSTESFMVSTDLQPGDELTFLGGDEPTATVADDGTVDAVLAEVAAPAGEPALPEGTPVVNQRGELVALYSHDGGTPHLVRLGALGQIEQLLATADNTSVWLGVVINNDPKGDLSVGAIDPEGPAAKAGLEVGDIILAVDDEPIDDCRALVAHLTVHRPGDVVVVSVQRAHGGFDKIAVTLASPKTAL